MIAFLILQTVLLAITGLAGTAVVFTRDPKRQVFVAAIYGLVQSVLFYVFHSPDVALSELAVGSIALPALVLSTLAKLESRK